MSLMTSILLKKLLYYNLWYALLLLLYFCFTEYLDDISDTMKLSVGIKYS